MLQRASPRRRTIYQLTDGKAQNNRPCQNTVTVSTQIQCIYTVSYQKESRLKSSCKDLLCVSAMWNANAQSKCEQ